MTDRLWAPWRMEYIEDLDAGGCVFCNAAKMLPAVNKDTCILAARENEYVIVNKFPYAFGHILVCPVRHVSNLSELTVEERASFFALVGDAQAAVEKAVSPQGINMGMNIGKDAGAGIEEHIHMHIIPRWRGDTNFMPTLANVKIMPAHLDKTYDLLAAAFTEL